MCVCIVSLFSRVQLFVNLWTAASRFFCPWDSPGKNTGVGCHFLLQEIVPTQRMNLCLLQLLHCRQFLYHWAMRKPYTHTHIHTHTCLYVCICVCICICVCMCICIYKTFIHTCAHMCVCIHMHTHVCVCVHTCMCMYMCLNMYKWIYAHKCVSVCVYLYMCVYNWNIYFSFWNPL